MVRKKSPTKIFNDDDYLDASGNYTQVPAPNPKAVIQAPSTNDDFDNAIRSIQQIVADSQSAREERQAAAEQRKEELAKARLENFTPLYERIDAARVNVELIRARFLESEGEGNSSSKTVAKTITSQGFEGECAYRKYVIRYSDGSVDSRPAPEDCGDGLGTSTIDNPVSTSTPPPAPTPPKPIVLPPPPPPPPKTAPIDTILFDEEAVPIEIMSDMIFEDIGGHEIINIARNDTINGQTVTYQPIKNLSSIQQQYNPNNVLALQNTSDKYFQNFSIKLDTKLPEEGSGPDAAYIYIEDATGDLIIELINLESDEQIEVEISLSGTIYEAEFNES